MPTGLRVGSGGFTRPGGAGGENPSRLRVGNEFSASQLFSSAEKEPTRSIFFSDARRMHVTDLAIMSAQTGIGN